MSDKYKERLDDLLISPHRDNLITGMYCDLRMFNEQDREISKILNDKTTSDKQKIELIKDIMMFSEDEE